MIFAVVNSMSEFALCITSGIPQTANQINSIFTAERNNNGIRILFLRQLRTGLIICAVFGAGVVLLANPIGVCFGVTVPLLIPLVCFAASLPAAMVNSILTEFYNSSNRTVYADFLTFGRIALFSVAAAGLLLCGGQTVWLFYPLSEALTVCVCCVRAFTDRRYRHESAADRLLMLDSSMEKQGTVVDFSTLSSAEEICFASEKISGFCAENNLPPKKAARISLAIEELLTMLTDKCYSGAQDKPFDLRAFSSDGTYGIRIRCSGKPFNVFDEKEIQASPDEFMGVTMIMSMAQKTLYQLTFGVNSLLIMF